MLGFFSSVMEFLFAIGTFILNAVTGAAKLISSLPKFWSFLSDTLVYIPSEISYFIFMGLYISIVFLLLKVVL